MGASFVNNTEILHFRVQFPAYSDRAVQNSSSNGGLTRTSTNHLMDDITPLRDMADRVGREVEHFAETLDRYNDRLRSEDSFDAAYELAMEYKAFAQDMVNKLKKKHETQRIREVKRDTSKRVQSSPDFGSTRRDVNGAAEGQNGERDTNVETLKHWQAEADTWELFRIMLQLRYNPNQQEMQRQKEEQLEALRTPHRYTPENEIWDRFMLENDAAKERYLVLKWLEESANHGDNDVDAIVEELENKSGTKGLWYNGWMETRERIKGDKRLGRTNTKRSDNNEPLVSNLDPDAPTRQKRSLEKADAFSERALWMICWEMLRRGKSWGEICDWCLERNQSWRAVSVGKAADGDLAVGMPGQSLGGLWRRICYATAKDGTTDEYEAAVYGLLSGDLDTVLAVCKTWDDHFYAHYNSLLLSQFDQYLQQVSPPRISPTLNKRFGLFNAVQHHGDSRSAGRNLVKRLKQQGSTAKQAQQATKLLQGSLIADTVEDLFANVGTAISDAAWLDGTSPVITPIRTAVAPGSSDFLAENSIVQDYDALRVATHILIILREFHITPSQRSAEADVLDNVIAAYIGILQAGGKRDNTLIYASKMAPKRAVASLAQVLGDVNDPREQRELITLMEQYGISPIEVLIEQYRSLVKDTLAERSAEEATLRVVEDTDEDIYPGKRIRRGFTDQTVGEAEQSIVAALMAFWVVDGQWRVTFEAAAFVLRKFLGKLLPRYAIVILIGEVSLTYWQSTATLPAQENWSGSLTLSNCQESNRPLISAQALTFSTSKN